MPKFDALNVATKAALREAAGFNAASARADASDIAAFGRVSLLSHIPQAEHAAIYAGTSTYDCLAALYEAVDEIAANPDGWYAGGPRIYAGPGRFYFGSTIELKKTVILEGDSVGQNGGYTTEFAFPANTTGIIVHRHNTIGSGVANPVTTGADATIIRHITLTGGEGASGHGLWLRARAEIDNVRIRDFAGNGCQVIASAGAGGSAEGNANNFDIRNCRISNNGGHGLYISGADANAGVVHHVDASANGGWGIYDSSFLGNTIVGCHTNGNTLGPYKGDSNNACGVLVGCYSEGGQPPSEMVAPWVVVGGCHACGFTEGSTAFHIGANTDEGTLSRFSMQAKVGSSNAFTALYMGEIDEAHRFTAEGDHVNGLSMATWDNAGGCWAVRHARLASLTPVRYTTNLNTFTAGRSTPVPAGNVLFAQGVWIGSSTGTLRKFDAGTAAPVAGEWAAGDRRSNSTPAVGQPKGWICTVAGTPGTWVSEGNL